MSHLDIAKQYVAAGLSVIGTFNKDRIPIKWKKFQTEYPTQQDLIDNFVSKNCQYLAIVCGKISGNIEVIDVDVKNDPTKTIWTKLWDKILDYYNQQPPFVLVETPSGGMHLYYTCDEIGRDQVLAKSEATKKPIIETRAEGGLIFAPPTEGYKSLSPILFMIALISAPQILVDIHQQIF